MVYTVTDVAQMLDAAREDEAIRFAEWASNGNWVFQIETGRWYNKYDEYTDITSAELYNQYKQNP